jgi:predicted DNA-binding protein with PD1-like motif
MKALRNMQYPRPRTLIHPGRFDPVRIQSLRAPHGRHIRLALQPGRSLFDGLVTPLAAIGVASASMTILGGSAEALQYCVAPRDPTGQAVIAYSDPIAVGRCYIVFGNATLGKSMAGDPLVHCHAAIRTGTGTVKGGHIITEQTTIGPHPIIVLVTALDEFELRQTYDPETNIPLMKPFKETHNG